MQTESGHPWRSPLLSSESEFGSNDATPPGQVLLGFGRATSVEPTAQITTTSPPPNSRAILPRRASLPQAPLSFGHRGAGAKPRRAPAPGTIDLATLSTASSPSPVIAPADADHVAEKADGPPKRPPRPKPTPSLSAFSTPMTGWPVPAPVLDVLPPLESSFLIVTPAPGSAGLPAIASPLHHDFPVPGAPRLGTGRGCGGSGSSSGSTSTLATPGGGFSPLPPTPASILASSPAVAGAGVGDDYFVPRISSSSQAAKRWRDDLLSPRNPAVGLHAPRLGNGEGFSPLPRTPSQIADDAAAAAVERPKLLRAWSSDPIIASPGIDKPQDGDESESDAEGEDDGTATEGERDAGDGWTRAEAVRKRILREWEDRRSSDPFKTPDRRAMSRSSPDDSPGSLSTSTSVSPASTQVVTPETDHHRSFLGQPKPVFPGTVSPSTKVPSSPSKPPTRPTMTRSFTSPIFTSTLPVGLGGGPVSPAAVFASSPLACRVLSMDDSSPISSSPPSSPRSTAPSSLPVPGPSSASGKRPTGAPSMMRSVSSGPAGTGSSVSPLRRTVSRRSTFTASATVAKRLAAHRDAMDLSARRSALADDDDDAVDADADGDEERSGEVIESGGGMAEVAGESLQSGLFAPNALVSGPSSSSSSGGRSKKRSRRSPANGRSRDSSPRGGGHVDGLNVVLPGAGHDIDLPDLPSYSRPPTTTSSSSASSSSSSSANSPFGTWQHQDVMTPPPLIPFHSPLVATSSLPHHASAPQAAGSFNPYFPIVS